MNMDMNRIKLFQSLFMIQVANLFTWHIYDKKLG